jgi:predicted Fe-S protein YdhL (DUF1289 family)
MSSESEKVDSPCVRNCCLDNNDICLGCARSLSEIVNWAASSNSEKLAVLALCEERKKEKSERLNK